MGKGKLIILQGPPYSGKTTWAQDYVRAHPNCFSVEYKQLKELYGDVRTTQAVELATIKQLLELGATVICDDCNNEPGHLEDLFNVADNNVEIKTFYTPFRACLKEDKRRYDEGLSFFGEGFLKAFYLRYYESKYREEECTDFVPTNNCDSELPNCVLCSLDHLVALHQYRTPNAIDLMQTDVCNPLIKTLLERFILDGITVFFVASTRTKEAYAKTFDWLAKNFPYYKTDMNTMKKFYKWNLLIPKADPFSSVVGYSKELYETNVKGKFNVLAVFENNKAVAEMWQNEGLLTCLINGDAEK